MRKVRTRALSAVLAFGLMIGLMPGPGGEAYAAEDTTAAESYVSETVSEDTGDGEKEEIRTGTETSENEGVVSETTDETGEDTVSEDTAAEPEGSEKDGISGSEAETEAVSEEDSEEVTEAPAEGIEEELPESGSAEAVPEAARASDDAGNASLQAAKQDSTAALGDLTAVTVIKTSDDGVCDTDNGWVKSDGNWYYYKNGKMVTGWLDLNGKKYYLGSDGIMLTGWQKISNKQYYFLADGAMAVGWKKIDSSWYFFESGVMVTGWKTISGEKYYFYNTGKMAQGVWIDNLWLRSADGSATDEIFSREYMGSPYYRKLQETLAGLKGETDIMKRVLKIAQSQEGYKNFAMAGYSVEQARADGNLWTGATKRSSGGTGNTEYTRWAQRFWKRTSESSQYADYDWCAIFSSWCLYQAGLYTGQDTSKKNWYYSYCADPRVEKNSIATSFNCDQAQVWYTPLASNKIAAYAGWNDYVHTEVDPNEIPYRPGGLIFFCWDGVGRYFSHVGIVVSFDREKHILTYISGNTSGEVATYDVYYDKTLWSGYTGYNSIMAYAEYYEGREGWKKEKNDLYYYQNGKPVTGWKNIDGYNYYFNTDGTMKTGWFQYNNNWYYLNTAGFVTKGWRKIDGAMYYFDNNGARVSGEQEIGGKKYLFSEEGIMYCSGWWAGHLYSDDGSIASTKTAAWHKDSTGWWFGGDGWYAKSETINIDGKPYTFSEKGYWVDPDAKTKTGRWRKNKIGWWYCYSDGTYPKNETVLINGKQQSFDKEGYWIDPEGKVKPGKWHKNKIGWWYAFTDGTYAKSETIEINGKEQSFDKEGYWIDPEEKTGKWHKNKTGWWFEYSDGTYVRGVTVKIKGVFYMFDLKGYLIEE